MAIKLSGSTLATLPTGVTTPSYDRSRLTPGLLHVGVGNFHRAHQAVYLDQLLATGTDQDWAIVGAGLKPYDAAVRSDLQRQDWLTTVVELAPEGCSAQICGSMIDYVPTNPDALVVALSRSEIRIASLTITEAGYFIDERTGGLDLDHPDVRHDIAQSDAPRTVFGCLLTALRRRREAGVAPFTVMSCDNIPENGKLTRTITCRLAQAQSSNFSNWVAANVAFPNSMVDCITPAVSERERHFVQKRFGIADPRPVVCEPYRQWVLEDNFPNGRPALERVGVEFVADVTSYELMKLRILNGGHAAIAYPAAVLGIHQVHEAMQHPAILAYLRKLVGEEIIPTLPAVADVDFHQYFETVCGRFLNSAVADTIERLCIDGSSRQPKFVLPTIQSRLEAGESIDGLALELALWCRYCAGVDQEGTAITIVDVNAEALTQHAQRARTDPDAFLELEMVFGSLGKAPALRRAFSSALETVWKTGVANTLRNYTRCSA